MSHLHWMLIVGAFFCVIAWRELSHRLEIQEIRNELREFRREQRESKDYLLQLLREQGSKYDVLLEMMTKERNERQKEDETVKAVIRGVFDVLDKSRLYISKLENDNKVTVALQRGKIGQLAKMIRHQKAELRGEYRTVVASMEDKLQSEYRAEVARSEEKANESHQIMNATLHAVVEWFISETDQSRRDISQCKNDTIALAQRIQQINFREPGVTIQNEVIVQSGHHLQESDHHYRNFGAKYGAMVGELIGGYAQDMVTGLWSKAVNLLARLR